jgi:antitoxin VapB
MLEMSRTKLFLSNRSQAVRLAKEVAFPDNVHEVTIWRDGERRVISPADRRWDDFFDEPGIDLGERDQSEPQAREPF